METHNNNENLILEVIGHYHDEKNGYFALVTRPYNYQFFRNYFLVINTHNKVVPLSLKEGVAILSHSLFDSIL